MVIFFNRCAKLVFSLQLADAAHELIVLLVYQNEFVHLTSKRALSLGEFVHERGNTLPATK